MELNMTTTFVLSIAVALLSFLVAAYFYVWVKKCPSSNEKIKVIGQLIAKGANTFLRREYAVLARFVAVAAVLIVVFLPSPIWLGNAAENIKMALAYIAGAVISALAGKIGIVTATKANVKSAEAAVKDIRHSFLSGFRGGAVMGMAVVGASLLGVTLVYMLTKDSSAVLGFSFGASSLALFAKAGGGIFTKTADISADLVGKVELGIPEDDPRNPAVIADNVGDVPVWAQTCSTPTLLQWLLRSSWRLPSIRVWAISPSSCSCTQRSACSPPPLACLRRAWAKTQARRARSTSAPM